MVRAARAGDRAAGWGKTGVQLMLMTMVTRISPSPSRAASSGVRSTRAVPSTRPAAPENAVILPSRLAVWARLS